MDKDLRWRTVGKQIDETTEIYISHLSDESLQRYHDSIRQQIDAERNLKHKLLNGRAIRQYVELLERELTSRDISVEKVAFAIL